MMARTMTASPTTPGVFAPAREVTDLGQCFFYHTMDLPRFGTVLGAWDLRGKVGAYLGGTDLRGRRVLELGTASGFLCFEMEKRGADVIAYDLSEKDEWDLVPFASARVAPAFERKALIRKLNNGWWLAHRALGSKARAVYGSVYAVPEGIGPVDVATFGCILLHLRDPFGALASAARLVRDTIIVTEHDTHRIGTSRWGRRLMGGVRALRDGAVEGARFLLGKRGPSRVRLARRHLIFLPDASRGEPLDTWWAFQPEVLIEMLAVLGFPRAKVTYHAADYDGRSVPMFTVVARRG